jgi:hypothetical protein
MSEPRQWFEARLRWAVLDEKQGLTHWREAEHIFLSEDRDTAFQEALRIGYAGEFSVFPTMEDKRAPTFDCRFAKVESLEELGMERTAFTVDIGEKPGHEAFGFDHEFDPAAHMPEASL